MSSIVQDCVHLILYLQNLKISRGIMVILRKVEHFSETEKVKS